MASIYIYSPCHFHTGITYAYCRIEWSLWTRIWSHYPAVNPTLFSHSRLVLWTCTSVTVIKHCLSACFKKSIQKKMPKVYFPQYRHWLRACSTLLETSHHLVTLISSITITSAKFIPSCSIGCSRGHSETKHHDEHNVTACRIFWVTAQPSCWPRLHTRILARLERKAEPTQLTPV